MLALLIWLSIVASSSIKDSFDRIFKRSVLQAAICIADCKFFSMMAFLTSPPELVHIDGTWTLFLWNQLVYLPFTQPIFISVSNNIAFITIKLSLWSSSVELVQASCSAYSTSASVVFSTVLSSSRCSSSAIFNQFNIIALANFRSTRIQFLNNVFPIYFLWTNEWNPKSSGNKSIFVILS